MPSFPPPNTLPPFYLPVCLLRGGSLTICDGSARLVLARYGGIGTPRANTASGQDHTLVELQEELVLRAHMQHQLLLQLNQYVTWSFKRSCAGVQSARRCMRRCAVACAGVQSARGAASALSPEQCPSWRDRRSLSSLRPLAPPSSSRSSVSHHSLSSRSDSIRAATPEASAVAGSRAASPSAPRAFFS